MNEARQVKELRRQTGAGILECKKALRRCNGDMKRALAELKKRDIDPEEPEPEVVD